MTRYQTLTMATAVATLVLIAIGAIVRTTGSGLGCPDWPLCHGQWVPPAEKTAIIEYSHRTAAAVVGFLIVAVALVTVRYHWQDRALRLLVIVALPLLGLQAWFGKETVERELPPEIVAIHLATALILLGILWVVAALAWLGPNRERIVSRDRDGFMRVAIIGAAVTFIVLLGGAYVVGADATAACQSWPGCDQAAIPFVDGEREQHIHWLHRIMVVGGLVAVFWVTAAGEQLRDAGQNLKRGVRLVATLYAVQILVGASNVWTDFSEASRVAHLALGAGIWAVLVVIIVAGRFTPGTVTSAAGEPGRTGPDRAAARV